MLPWQMTYRISPLRCSSTQFLMPSGAGTFPCRYRYCAGSLLLSPLLPRQSTHLAFHWRRIPVKWVGCHSDSWAARALLPHYVENFVDVVSSLFPVKSEEKVNCAPRFLTYSSAIGVDRMTTALDTGQRTVRLGANPVGINVKYIQQLMAEEAMQEKIAEMKTELNGKKMIISAERLDYVKGPLEKIVAFEQFLEEYPEFHGEIELVNICTPPAEGMKIYDDIRLELEQAVGRINGKYGNMSWTPVRLFFRSVPFEEILVYYAVADIAWITPLRDGLNLVAREYIAVQGEMKGRDKGVLILSEFAGAAVEFSYALLTNPYDPKSLKDNLLQALLMNAEEKNMRMERLYEQVSHYDIDFWAEDFMTRVHEIRDNNLPPVPSEKQKAEVAVAEA